MDGIITYKPLKYFSDVKIEENKKAYEEYKAFYLYDKVGFLKKLKNKLISILR